MPQVPLYRLLSPNKQKGGRRAVPRRLHTRARHAEAGAACRCCRRCRSSRSRASRCSRSSCWSASADAAGSLGAAPSATWLCSWAKTSLACRRRSTCRGGVGGPDAGGHEWLGLENPSNPKLLYWKPLAERKMVIHFQRMLRPAGWHSCGTLARSAAAASAHLDCPLCQVPLLQRLLPLAAPRDAALAATCRDGLLDLCIKVLID